MMNLLLNMAFKNLKIPPAKAGGNSEANQLPEAELPQALACGEKNE